MTGEADPTPPASGTGAAPSPDKRKKKGAKTASKKQLSASSKPKAVKQKLPSSKSKRSNNQDHEPTVEGASVPAEEHQVVAQPEVAPAETEAAQAEPKELLEACEHVDAGRVPAVEDGKPTTDSSQGGQAEDVPGGVCESKDVKEEALEVQKQEEGAGGIHETEKAEQQTTPCKREGADQRPVVKRPRGPPPPPAEVIPRTSINGVCGGPWRSAATCSWMHDIVGCTCRREAGGPLPEKWSAFPDFVNAVDLRDTAERKLKGLLKAAKAEGEKASDDAEAAGGEKGEQQEGQEQQEKQHKEEAAVPFTSPNPLMVSKLLLLPCKTFLSTAFAPHLFRCRPFSPAGLQEQFDGAQRRKAGVGRRYARGRAASQQQQEPKTPGGGEKREETEKQKQEEKGEQQEEKQQEEEQQEEQKQVKEKQTPGVRPTTYGCECLIDEGRMRLLSVVNLCLTERHYEPQLLRRDGLPVFWHKSQGGGEVPTAEGLLVYFKLLSLLTMQGLRTAEQWAAAADCAICNPGASAKDGGSDGPPCKCNWRFTVVTHCTHGLNRTGYMLCALLMALLRLSAEEAQRVFAEARGQAIPRQEIISALEQLEKEGISKAHRAALEAPELDSVYAENAQADGVDLTKGSCCVRVAAASTAAKTRNIPIMEKHKKTLTAYREAERQRLLRAKQPRKREQAQQQQKSGQQQQQQKQEQEQQEQKQEQKPEETKKDTEAGKTEEQKTEKDEGVKEEVTTKEGTGEKPQEAAAEVQLTEEDLKRLPEIPSTIPNNGVVLFGPLSNALLAPEELLLYLLDLQQDLRLCDYRVLVTGDVNSHVGYPQTLKKGNLNKRKRRVGVPQAKAQVTPQEEAEKDVEKEAEQVQDKLQEKPQQQNEEQREEQQEEKEAEKKEEGKQKEGSGAAGVSGKRLDLHYILYVQAADSFSFETLLTADLVSIRKQPLTAFTLDFLPYLLNRGKELDHGAIKWSKLHPPRPRRGAAIFPLPGGPLVPLPGFGRPMPPPHLNFMGPGGPRGGRQDGFGAPFMRGNGRPGGRGEGDFGM